METLETEHLQMWHRGFGLQPCCQIFNYSISNKLLVKRKIEKKRGKKILFEINAEEDFEKTVIQKEHI